MFQNVHYKTFRVYSKVVTVHFAAEKKKGHDNAWKSISFAAPIYFIHPLFPTKNTFKILNMKNKGCKIKVSSEISVEECANTQSVLISAPPSPRMTPPSAEVKTEGEPSINFSSQPPSPIPTSNIVQDFKVEDSKGIEPRKKYFYRDLSFRSLSFFM